LVISITPRVKVAMQQMESTVNGTHGVKKQLLNIVVPDPSSVPNQEEKKEQIEGKEAASLFDMPTSDSVNTHDVQNYVVADIDESEGENNMAIDDMVVGEALLAAIPEASPAKSASPWSKCWAGDTDEDSLERATKL
jgi:hypothetical protein